MHQEGILDEIKKKSDQVQKLMVEINQLKGLLGDDESNPSDNLSDDEKINLFMSYFRGRDKVYPYLSISKSDPSQKYYMPKCANEWKHDAKVD